MDDVYSLNPRSLKSDMHSAYFATIGRALFLAQRYERLVRGHDLTERTMALASPDELVNLESNPDLGQKLHDTMDRMLGDSTKVLKKDMQSRAVGNEQEETMLLLKVKKLFDSAVKARNAIAHDCTLGVFDPHDFHDDGMVDSLEELADEVRAILDAFVLI